MTSTKMYIRHLSANEKKTIIMWILDQEMDGNGFETVQAVSTDGAVECKLAIGGLADGEFERLQAFIERETWGMFEHACIGSTSFGFED